MKINIIFISSKIDFSLADKKVIREIIKKHAEKAAKVLSFKEILTFTVYPWEQKLIHTDN